ncbi:MAG: hypothetical protein ACR2ML_05865 [Solirubrobacteraceae bacterium]
MKLRSLVPVLGSCGALALVACGDDDDEGSKKAEEQSTPAVAVKEIGETETALDQAVSQLRAGDRKQAEETVAEAYLQHFEKVEGPLGKADPKLKEELEEAISGEVREKIRSGASVSQVTKLVSDIKGDLATAEGKLK